MIGPVTAVALIAALGYLFFENWRAALIIFWIGLLFVFLAGDLVVPQFIGEGGAKWLKP